MTDFMLNILELNHNMIDYEWLIKKGKILTVIKLSLTQGKTVLS